MPATDTEQTQCECQRRRALNHTGHWQQKLDGHGFAYFDELTVAYRTLPARDPAQDPWARAAAQAVQKAREAEAAKTAAVKVLADAQAAVTARAAADASAGSTGGTATAAAVTDAELQADVAAKKQLATDAAEKLEEANQAAVLAQGAVEAKIAAAVIIVELIDKKERGAALWKDILTFESALLRMLWFEQLKIRLHSLRLEYRAVLGAVAAQAMEPTYLDLKTVTAAKDMLPMQAEAANLLAELHESYVTAPQKEWQKTRLTLILGAYTGGLVLGLFFLMIFFHCHLLLLVLMAGALGAGLSAFQRIQAGQAGNALLNLRLAKWHSLSTGLAPAFGALSALLLALIFAAGLVSGNFFPKVSLRADGCATNEPVCCASASAGADAPATLQTSLPPVTVTQSLVANVLVSNVVSLTNLYALTNRAATVATTNASADPATWRDCQTFCRHHWVFASGADLALLLIWAFIGGFSERLVPDMLSRLAKKAEEKV